MRRPLALLLALLALGTVAGCGDDDEDIETVPSTPELTVPGDEETIPEPKDTTSTTDTVAPDGGAGTPDSGSEAPSQSPQQTPQDSPQNDTPPAPSSPQERFENFCEDNPGAC